MNVEQLLRTRGINFELLPHATMYSASRTAQQLHVPGKRFAKTVVLHVDGRTVVAVIPSNRFINIDLVRQALAAQEVHLAHEDEFSQLFPDCELGAVPPFGSQYRCETVLDDNLAKAEDIIFEGNTHRCAIHMRYHDFEEIEHPRIAHIAN